MNPIYMVAFDLGASSGRAILGSFDGQKIELKEIYRFANTPVYVNGHLHWNILKLFHEMKMGLRMVKNLVIKIESICIDTWGVDIGYFDKYGDLLYSPYHYRDHRVNEYENALYKKIPKEELFFESGVQPASINTLTQVYADLNRKPFLKKFVDKVMFTPDIFSYLFSGQVSNEFTIASTSGLLNKEDRKWSKKIFEKLDIPVDWFSSTTNPCTILHSVLPEIIEELDLEEFKIIVGAAHDTASAVLAIPYQDKETSAFISCGTWSLIGIETEKPVVTKEAFESGLTNEGCSSGGNRLLKNATGLWVMQELQRDWSHNGHMVSFAQMTDLAAKVLDNQTIIDLDEEIFLAPGHMERKIVEYCQRTNQIVPASKGEFVRVIIDSLALSYQKVINHLEDVTGKTISTIHMVGGGIQNQLLCQATANLTNRKVIAGPIEASAMGNVLSQLIALSIVNTQDTITEILNHSFETITYTPNMNIKEMN